MLLIINAVIIRCILLCAFHMRKLIEIKFKNSRWRFKNINITDDVW